MPEEKLRACICGRHQETVMPVVCGHCGGWYHENEKVEYQNKVLIEMIAIMHRGGSHVSCLTCELRNDCPHVAVDGCETNECLVFIRQIAEKKVSEKQNDN